MSSTILHKYFREYGAMLTYSNLRDLIFNGETSTQIMSTSQTPTTTAIKKSSTKRSSTKKSIPINEKTSITLEHSPNDMLTIHDDDYFGIVFNNFRKQKSPLAYVHYKMSTSCLNVFIKNPVGFPLIIVNIPNSISKENLYINPAYINEDNSVCYSLPLNDNKFKNNLTTKQTNYTIRYSINDGKIAFSYQSYSNGSPVGKYETSSITEEPLKECFNVLISDKIDPIGLMLIDENFDALSIINNMSLNIIAKQTANDSFNTADSSKTNNKIILTANGSMYFNQSASSSDHESILCNRSDSIRWNTNFTNILPNDNEEYEFELYPYTNMFKNNYMKVLMNDTRAIYYVFGQFANEIYVLGKIITSHELDQDGIRTFTISNLFDDDFSTKELYVCKTLNSFRK